MSIVQDLPKGWAYKSINEYLAYYAALNAPKVSEAGPLAIINDEEEEAGDKRHPIETEADRRQALKETFKRRRAMATQATHFEGA